MRFVEVLVFDIIQSLSFSKVVWQINLNFFVRFYYSFLLYVNVIGAIQIKLNIFLDTIFLITFKSMLNHQSLN